MQSSRILRAHIHSVYVMCPLYHGMRTSTHTGQDVAAVLIGKNACMDFVCLRWVYVLAEACVFKLSPHAHASTHRAGHVVVALIGK